MTAASPSIEPKSAERRALGVSCGAHALHDGYTELIYVLLPLWQAEFGLSYAASGMLRTVFSGTMASLQIPASFLAERVGTAIVLAAGTALCGGCFVLAGFSAGFSFLIAALLLGGLGASTQHPLGSALVARAFSGARSLTALGTYNFAGDIGKMAIPVTASLMLYVLPWRTTAAILGLIGFVGAAAILLLLPHVDAMRRSDGKSQREDTSPVSRENDPHGFSLLLALGSLDSITRGGFLVFLPFLMIGKGATVQVAGLALTTLFLGGAVGKLACAWLGARFGVIGAIIVTQALTTAGILALLMLPLTVCFVVLPLVGAMLNGTSSLTYGSVPRFVSAERQARAFGVFYTGTLVCGALSPTVSGFVGDRIGLETTLVILALLALTTIPFALVLRPRFASLY